MLGGMIGSILSAAKYSIFGLLIFVAFAILIFYLFTRKSSPRAFSAAARMAWTGITTPFVFVRNAFGIVSDASEAEKDFSGTREFVLFRYSRLQYLLIAVFAVLYLSATATAVLFTLYPSSEIAQSNEFRDELRRLATDQDTTNHNIADASKPDFAAQLLAHRDKSQAAYIKQIQDDNIFQSGVAFTGPMRIQISTASDVNSVLNLRSQLDAYFAQCPNGLSPGGLTWTGFTPDQCAQFKTFLASLADRKIAEINLASDVNQANSALGNRQIAIATFKSRLNDLQVQISNTQGQLDSISIGNGKWIWPHLSSAVAQLIASLVAFLVFTWVAAIFVDVLNWIIFMMRSMEKRNSV